MNQKSIMSFFTLQNVISECKGIVLYLNNIFDHIKAIPRLLKTFFFLIYLLGPDVLRGLNS